MLFASSLLNISCSFVVCLSNSFMCNMTRIEHQKAQNCLLCLLYISQKGNSQTTWTQFQDFFCSFDKFLSSCQSKCSQISAKLQSKCSQNTVIMQSKCCQNSDKMQLTCSQITVKVQPKCSHNAVKMQPK